MKFFKFIFHRYCKKKQDKAKDPISDNLKPLDQITIRQFMNALYKNDYSGIGTGTQEQLQEHFSDLYEEYCFATDNKKYQNWLSLQSRINRAAGKYTLIQGCLLVLQYKYDEGTAKHLKNLGYDYDFINNRFDSILKTAQKAKAIIIQLANLNGELEQIKKKSSEKKSTEADFMAGITAASTTLKIGYININEVDMAYYCSLMRQYKDYCKILESERGKHGR